MSPLDFTTLPITVGTAADAVGLVVSLSDLELRKDVLESVAMRCRRVRGLDGTSLPRVSLCVGDSAAGGLKFTGHGGGVRVAQLVGLQPVGLSHGQDRDRRD